MSCDDNPLFKKFQSYLAMVAPALPNSVAESISEFFAHQGDSDSHQHKYLDLIAHRLTNDEDGFEKAAFALSYFAEWFSTPNNASPLVLSMRGDPQLVDKVLFTAEIYDEMMGKNSTEINKVISESVTALSHQEQAGDTALAKAILDAVPLTGSTVYQAESRMKTLDLGIYILSSNGVLLTEDAVDLIGRRVYQEFASDNLPETPYQMLGFILQKQDGDIRAAALRKVLFREPPFDQWENWQNIDPEYINKLGMMTGYQKAVSVQAQMKKAILAADMMNPQTYAAVNHFARKMIHFYPAETFLALQKALDARDFYPDLSSDDSTDPEEKQMRWQAARSKVLLLAAQVRAGDKSAEESLLSEIKKVVQTQTDPNNPCIQALYQILSLDGYPTAFTEEIYKQLSDYYLHWKTIL